MARRVRQQPQEPSMRLAPLLLLSLLALVMHGAQAFSFSYFGSKGSSTVTAAGANSAQYARYLAHRPLPGTDAFAKVSEQVRG